MVHSEDKKLNKKLNNCFKMAFFDSKIYAIG